jgi:hypothetical protein
MREIFLSEKKKPKPHHVKKVPLLMGLLFVGLGLWNLVLILMGTASESMEGTYATLVVAFLGFGITLLDKSGILEK